MSVPEKEFGRDEKIIGSHVVYKLKVDEKGEMMLKSRICPQGNRDKLKDDLRKDSSTVKFDVLRLDLSIETELDVVLGHVDIKGAYI